MSPEPVAVPGVLLTGGASRRMGGGVDKASIVWRGETLAARAARVLSAVADPVIEVGPGRTSLRATRESPAGQGPVRALLAGVTALGTSGPVVLLACDMPFVEAPLLALLAQWPGTTTVVPRRSQQPQYLCARYGPEWLAAATRAGATSFRSMDHVSCTFVDESDWLDVAPAEVFDDIDTPEDRARRLDT